MATSSATDLLVLHALLLMGVADDLAVAQRFGLDQREVRELLLDDEARGWVHRVRHATRPAWALTGAGHQEHSRQLAAEMAAGGLRGAVLAVYEEFVPLDARFSAALAYWQVGPTPSGPLAGNEHRDGRWDDRVLIQLHVLVHQVAACCARLEQVLDRFRGYPGRLSAALRQVDKGELAWLDQLRDVSLAAVWFELREDLLTTLQLEGAAAAHG